MTGTTVLIYTAESTGAFMERTKMPNLRNGSKRGFEPGLTSLRVWRSTTELPRSIDSQLRALTTLLGDATVHA